MCYMLLLFLADIAIIQYLVFTTTVLLYYIKGSFLLVIGTVYHEMLAHASI